jgi:predicted GNAT family acetyltransferase
MATEVTVEVRDNPDDCRFEAYVDGALAGFATYVVGHDAYNFVHTEVDDAFEGQGVGSALVRQSLDQLAERAGVRVTASCPFVRAWMRRHPDYLQLGRR